MHIEKLRSYWTFDLFVFQATVLDISWMSSVECSEKQVSAGPVGDLLPGVLNQLWHLLAAAWPAFLLPTPQWRLSATAIASYIATATLPLHAHATHEYPAWHSRSDTLCHWKQYILCDRATVKISVTKNHTSDVTGPQLHPLSLNHHTFYVTQPQWYLLSLKHHTSHVTEPQWHPLSLKHTSYVTEPQWNLLSIQTMNPAM